jgi:hypothetical protein
MKAAEAKALLFQRKVAYKDYEGKIPGIPELDDQLGILELPASELTKISKGGESEEEQLQQMAAIVVQALVMRGSKEPVFNTTDIPTVVSLGLSRLTPIVEEVNKLSGVTPEMVAAAKKN